MSISGGEVPVVWNLTPFVNACFWTLGMCPELPSYT